MKTFLIILTIFRVAFVGDPQADNATQISYAQKSIYRELRERKDLDMVIFLGDLVNDRPELIAASKASIDSLGCPWFAVPGNHDRDIYRGQKGRRRDVRTWESVIGYTDTAFVSNGVEFILMNDVRTKGTSDYEAGLTESQRQWLKRTMEATPDNSKIVFVTHIPLSEMHDKDSLAMMFEGKENVLLVSGHTHQVKRRMLEAGGRKFEDLVAGASCGSWWRGFKDAAGVPDALMNCGSPRGYFVCDFTPDGSHSLLWKTVGDDTLASATATDSTLVVNVFGGAEEGSVSVRARRLRLNLERRRMLAPEVEERIEYNSSTAKEYRSLHKEEYIPMRRQFSPHVWKADLADASRLKGKKIAVIYNDGRMSFRTRVTVR